MAACGGEGETITVVHDNTALKELDRKNIDFVAMVAHEIRGPLGAILAQLKVVLDGLAGEVTPEQRRILTRIAEKITSLVTLSSELLDLALLESGMLSQEREHLNLVELIKDQVAFYQAAAQAKKIRLEMEGSGSIPAVFANKRNIAEVLSNLIGNAINYTPEGGKITVSATRDGECLKIRVQDNGIGIAAEDLEYIFDPFYRVKSDQTRFVIGTGLGLALVKRLVEAHEGFIRVESEPGRGSTFQVFLPYTESCPEKAQ